MKKTGTNDSKTGGNAFFFLQKTESVSWGLPLMNGGLKIGLYTNLYTFIREVSALYVFKFLEMFKTICLLRLYVY